MHTEPVEPFSAGDDAEMLTSYRKMLKPFHYPLKTLNILDLKVENVKLIYKKKVYNSHIKCSTLLGINLHSK